MNKNNKTFFDDFQVSSQRNLGRKKKDNGLWMPMLIGCSKNWRHFLAPGGIKEVEFLEDEIFLHCCAFFRVSTARGKWRCMVFRKELLLTSWLSLGRWRIAWGWALWKHSSKRLAELANVHQCTCFASASEPWLPRLQNLKPRGCFLYFQLVIFLVN